MFCWLTYLVRYRSDLIGFDTSNLVIFFLLFLSSHSVPTFMNLQEETLIKIADVLDEVQPPCSFRLKARQSFVFSSCYRSNQIFCSFRRERWSIIYSWKIFVFTHLSIREKIAGCCCCRRPICHNFFFFFWPRRNNNNEQTVAHTHTCLVRWFMPVKK